MRELRAALNAANVALADSRTEAQAARADRASQLRRMATQLAAAQSEAAAEATRTLIMQAAVESGEARAASAEAQVAVLTQQLLARRQGPQPPPPPRQQGLQPAEGLVVEAEGDVDVDPAAGERTDEQAVELLSELVVEQESE